MTKIKWRLNHIEMLCLSMFLIFLALVLRNEGLYPTAMSDEYSYSKLARLMPFRESPLPNYLYFKIFYFTNYCGDEFLSCSKIFNAFLYVASGPFLYLTAKRIADKSIALWLTIITLLSPISSYTAYFIPESSYFLGFWIFTWFFLGLDLNSKSVKWLAGGSLFGISALIKPHSLLFFPAIALYILLLAIPGFTKKNVFQSIISLVVFSLGLIATKFIISYNLAGKAGLTLFGPMYGAFASSAGSKSDHFSELMSLAFQSIQGHALTISIIYSLPLVIIFISGLRSFSTNRPVTTLERTNLFALIVLCNLLCVVGLFTASIAGHGYETIARLHLRYYNFLLPLLAFIAAGSLKEKKFFTPRAAKSIATLFVSCLVIYAYHTRIKPYATGFIDSPELSGIVFQRTWFNIIAGFSLVSVIAWFFYEKIGLKIYSYVVFPVAMLVSTYYVNLQLRTRMQIDVYDKAGIFAKHYLSKDEISKIVIVGTEEGALFRTLFYLDAPTVGVVTIPEGAPYDTTQLPSGVEWALVVGDHPIPDKTFFKIQMDGFVLARGVEPTAIHFKESHWPGLVASSQGLSYPEFWGTWSDAEEVKFNFSRPLPKNFRLELTAHTFGTNVGKEFEASIGSKKVPFTLTEKSGDRIELEFENPENSSQLRFKVPEVKSPLSMGISEEKRKLGIGFVEMKVVPL